jgi:hypothetical protein
MSKLVLVFLALLLAALTLLNFTILVNICRYGHYPILLISVIAFYYNIVAWYELIKNWFAK